MGVIPILANITLIDVLEERSILGCKALRVVEANSGMTYIADGEEADHA